jgi:hypothetical protein
MHLYGTAWWATWIFCGAFFVEAITIGTTQLDTKSGQVEIVVFGTLILITGMSKLKSPSYIAWIRTWLIFTLFMTITAIYLIFPSSALSAYTSQSHFLKEAFIYSFSYAIPGIFAALFYQKDLFVDVFWLLTRLSIWLALTAYAISRFSGHVVLVNSQTGGLRLQGLLSEPSAWAPIVAVALLAALRRKSTLYTVLILLVALLTKSPTVYIVLAISIPLYYLLTIRQEFKIRRFVFLLVIAVAIPFIVNFLQTANSATYLNSQNEASVVVGRLISGVQNIESNGALGTNDRFANTTQVIADTEDAGLMNFGGGPGSSNVYFPAKYPTLPGQGVVVRTNALWVDVLFDFGRLGVTILFLLLAVSVIRIRKDPVMAELLLPFIVASFINSASGIELYQFTILAIFLFGFGWGLPRTTLHSRMLLIQ